MLSELILRLVRLMGRLLCVIWILLTLVSSAWAKRYSDAEWKAMFVRHPRPDYPVNYRRRHLTGSGLYRIYVDERGEVTSIGIITSTGHRELDLHVMKTLIRWRAVPGLKREVDMPISFVMQ